MIVALFWEINSSKSRLIQYYVKNSSYNLVYKINLFIFVQELIWIMFPFLSSVDRL